ncbi:Uncharacterized protein dnm_031060 [Desulfonema magnum]|uniref:Uncharacterized protein n=1 Tax=Desulfonema magnum TaxID=45655 RepID=A0A975BJZ3_9BACT|nr:Uncharacterized protein dnm_031060 [Desulfonema magnum]
MAEVGGIFSNTVFSYLETECGLFQWLYPELSYLGMNMWKMTKEYYDHANFRIHCREMLKCPLIQFTKSEYQTHQVRNFRITP